MRLIDPSVVKRFRSRMKLREDYQSYVKRVTPGYVDGWMVRDLCRRLQRFSEAVRRRESPRLAISMPPRHGKTLHGGERFAPWHLGHAPGDEIIFASYGMDLARQMTREARTLIREETTARAFPDLHLSKDSAEKADWLTTLRGGARAAGAGGALTGRGADILIIDDPFKNHAEALSPRVREDRWNWYVTTARSRVSPGGGVLMIGTRWHQDDLIARALEYYEHEGWEVINYPAIAMAEERHEITGEVLRVEGEPLQPERWTADLLSDIERGMPRAWWLALYQGQPTDPEGAVWSEHHWRRWTDGIPAKEMRDIGWKQKPKSFERIYVSCDLTFGSTSESASYNVLQTWGLHAGDLYLIEEERGRWEWPEQRAKVKAIAHRRPGAMILIEEKANGKAMLSELKRIVRTAQGIKPDGKGDKVARAVAASPYVLEGRMLVPAPPVSGEDKTYKPEWCASTRVDMEDWMKEVTEFPSHPSDDRVDAVSQLAQHVFVDNAPGRLYFTGGGRG